MKYHQEQRKQFARALKILAYLHAHLVRTWVNSHDAKQVYANTSLR